MSETEIDLARAYLVASGQDPVAALIRSVKDLVRIRESSGSAGGGEGFVCLGPDEGRQQPDRRSDPRLPAGGR